MATLEQGTVSKKGDKGNADNPLKAKKKTKSSSWLEAGTAAVLTFASSKPSYRKETSQPVSVVGVRKWILDQQGGDENEPSTRTRSTASSSLPTVQQGDNLDEDEDTTSATETWAPSPIPFFDKSGARLSQQERRLIATQRGICLDCGVKTYVVDGAVPLPVDTDDVFKGICIQCRPSEVPPAILSAWKSRHVSGSKKIHFVLKRRSAPRKSTSSHSVHSVQTPKQRSWPTTPNPKGASPRASATDRPRRGLNRHSSDGNVGGQNAPKLVAMMKCLAACDYESFFRRFHDMSSSEFAGIITCMKAFRSHFVQTLSSMPHKAILPSSDKWVPAILSKTKATDEDAVVQCFLTLLTLSTISEKHRRSLVKRGAMKAAYYVLSSVQQGFSSAREVAMALMNYVKANETRFAPNDATIRQFGIILMSPLVSLTTNENALQALYHTARQLDEKSPRYEIVRKVVTKKDTPEMIITMITNPGAQPSTLQAGLGLLWRFSDSEQSSRCIPANQRNIEDILSVFSREQCTFDDQEFCCGILANLVLRYPISPTNAAAWCAAIMKALSRPEFVIDGSLAFAGGLLIRNLMVASPPARAYLGDERHCIMLVIDWLTKYPEQLSILELCGEILARSDPEKVISASGLQLILEVWQTLDLAEGAEVQAVRDSFTTALASLSRLRTASHTLATSSLVPELVHLAEIDEGHYASSACTILRNILITVATSSFDIETSFPGVPLLADGREACFVTEDGVMKVFDILSSFEHSETLQHTGLCVLCDAYFSKAMATPCALEQLESVSEVMNFSERHNERSINYIRNLMRSHKGNIGIQSLCCQVLYNMFAQLCGSDLSPRSQYLLAMHLNPSWNDLLDIFDDVRACRSLPTMLASSFFSLVLTQLGDTRFAGMIVPEILLRVARAVHRFGGTEREFGSLLSAGILAYRANDGTFDGLHTNEIIHALLLSIVSGNNSDGVKALLSWHDNDLKDHLSDTSPEVIHGMCLKSVSSDDSLSQADYLRVLLYLTGTVRIETVVSVAEAIVYSIDYAMNRFPGDEEVISSALTLALACSSRSVDLVATMTNTNGFAEKIGKAMAYHLGSRQVQYSCCLLIPALSKCMVDITWEAVPVLNCLLAHLPDEQLQLAAHSALGCLAPFVADEVVEQFKEAIFYGLLSHFKQAQVVASSLHALCAVLTGRMTRPSLSELQFSFILKCLIHFPLYGEVQATATELLRHYASEPPTLKMLCMQSRQALPLLFRAAVNFPLHCREAVKHILVALSSEYTGFEQETSNFMSLLESPPSSDSRTIADKDLADAASDRGSHTDAVVGLAKGKAGHRPPNLSKKGKGRRQNKKGGRKHRKGESEDSDDDECGGSDSSRTPPSRLERRSSSRGKKQKPIVDKIAFLQSSPLVKWDREGEFVGMGRLDNAAERRVISKAFEEAGANIECIFDICTYDRLGAVLARDDVTIVHISCHGDPNHLVIEDECGGAQWLTVDQIKAWICVRQKGLKFAFISACHSERIGGGLIEAGVDHVICCERDKAIRVETTIAFQKSFWRAFASGYTVQASFDRAQTDIRNSSILGREDLITEMDKFRLLPEDGDHSFRLRANPEGPSCEASRIRGKESWNISIPAPVDFFGRQIDAYEIMRGLRNSRLVRVWGGRRIGKKTLVRYVCHYIAERRHIQDVEKILWFPTVVRDASEAALSDLFERLFEAPEQENDTRTICRILDRLLGRRLILVLEARKIPDVHNFVRLVLENNATVKIILVGSSDDVLTDNAIPCTTATIETGPLDIASTLAFFFYIRSTMKVRTRAEIHEEATLYRKLLVAHDSNRLWRKEIESLVGNGKPETIRDAAMKLTLHDFERLQMISNKDPCVLTFATRAELVQKGNLLTYSLKEACRNGDKVLARKLQGVCDDVAKLKDDYPEISSLERQVREYQEEKERAFEMGLTERAIQNLEQQKALQARIQAEKLAEDEMIKDFSDFEERPIYSISELDELIRRYTAKKRIAFDDYNVANARESTIKLEKYEKKRMELGLSTNLK